MLTFFQQEQLIVFYFTAKVKDKEDSDTGVLISYKTIFLCPVSDLRIGPFSYHYTIY